MERRIFLSVIFIFCLVPGNEACFFACCTTFCRGFHDPSHLGGTFSGEKILMAFPNETILHVQTHTKT